MTDPTSLIPISDEQAKLGRKALEVLQGLGGFLREMFGTVPEDLVGYFGGDLLKLRRAENFARIVQEARERLEARGSYSEPPSISILLPIVVASADESRDELVDIWARLLAAAADPTRAKSFRLAFIETAKKMDPLDAAVIRGLQAAGGGATGQTLNTLAEELHASRDEVDVSIGNLIKLGLVYSPRPETHIPTNILPLGREFLRAISD
jgi:hypothetical protein